uniref:Uncharacterized protein n=1 Tax=Arundo donax TaxID=35708 RepID=A0A0A9BQD7_ARUDO
MMESTELSVWASIPRRPEAGQGG